ncbi:response regulator [Bremerella cremea]|uniref:response regulator n=1 Tax=Bremerella cremea TaxID=1031537 RepID=UPI0031EAE998
MKKGGLTDARLQPFPQEALANDVLLVDDNRSSLNVVSKMLGNWGLALKPFQDGGTALAFWQNESAKSASQKLLIVDDQMPSIEDIELLRRMQSDLGAGDAKAILLTHGVMSEAAMQELPCRIDAVVTKPVKQSDLFDAMVTVLGFEELARRQEQTSGERHAFGLWTYNILLAEDNPVNQKLASLLLQKCGHTVHVVADGKQAVEAYPTQPFDLILMDVQMPIMDGFAATAEIRRLQKTQGSRIPIVAMTAHAMKGDRERCLEAGMDDYVTKPINANVLYEVIDRVMTTQTPEYEATEEVVEAEEAALPIYDEPESDDTMTLKLVDYPAALTNVGGDHDLLVALIGVFLEDSERLLDELQNALAARDAPKLQRSAHSMKDSFGYFSASSGLEAAKRMEEHGAAENFEAAEVDLQILIDQFQAIRPGLEWIQRGTFVVGT